MSYGRFGVSATTGMVDGRRSIALYGDYGRHDVDYSLDGGTPAPGPPVLLPVNAEPQMGVTGTAPIALQTLSTGDTPSIFSTGTIPFGQTQNTNDTPTLAVVGTVTGA